MRIRGSFPTQRSSTVKKIEAVIRHYKLEEVKNALTAAGVIVGR